MGKAIDPPQSGLLYSGGVDSSILLLQLLGQGYRVHPIYVAGGLIWETAELAAARRFLDATARPGLAELTVLELPLGDLYGEHWSVTGRETPGADSPDQGVFLLGRNPLLVIKARLWCQTRGIGQLAIGCLQGSPFADASLEFFAEFEQAMDRAAMGRVRLARPLTEKAPAMLAAGARRLELTFSCLAPRRELHCGACNKCAERRRAFAAAGLADRTLYASDRPAPAGCDALA